TKWTRFLLSTLRVAGMTRLLGCPHPPWTMKRTGFANSRASPPRGPIMTPTSENSNIIGKLRKDVREREDAARDQQEQLDRDRREAALKAKKKANHLEITEAKQQAA
ncbi:unnamed protein product, partial [Pylaiella littoralis]